MAYDINLSATDAAGNAIGVVYLRNAPEDADKIIRISESLAVDGWTGRPVILANAGDHHIALTGSHRLAAAIGTSGLVEAVYLPEDMTSDDWDAIDAANDDDDLLAALTEIAEGRDDMGEIVAIMQAEVESN